MEDTEVVKDLREKLFEVLHSKSVESNGSIINLRTLKNILNESIGEYNKFFFGKVPSLVYKYNRRVALSNIFKYKRPYISKIIPVIDNDESYLEIDLSDLNGKKAGRIIMDFDYRHFALYDIGVDNESYQAIVDLINDNLVLILKTLALLETFRKENPGIDYRWDKNCPNENDLEVIDNGLLTVNFRLNNLSSIIALFSDSESNKIARECYLYDYLECYSDEILSKMSVDINDLNPLYKHFVSKRITLGETRTLSN